MIKAFTAYTEEVDDKEAAVAEILGKIDLTKLGKKSVGIITCYSEFIDNGIVEALSNKLPFDVIGSTTMGNAACGGAGHLGLTLMVLTGGDVEFSAAVSGPLSKEQDAPLREMYEAASQKLRKDPVFIIAFMPLFYDVGGEVFLDILSNTSGLPVFGTIAVDHTKDYHEAKVIYNGKAYKDSLSMVIVSGEVSPKFLIASLSDERALKQNAIITGSQGNILKEVNGIPAVQYMESLGLTKDGQIEGPSTIPFIVDYNDGTKPVVRAIFAQTPEGYAVCGGAMPVNSTLSIGALDYNDVMETSHKIINDVIEGLSSRGSALLLFSCVGRNYALGVRTGDEMEKVNRLLNDKIPFMMAYSGGEICPLYDRGDKLKNRFHNDTIIACLL
ncbi:MAG: FIST C-terminal domain-containing protein [Chitinispirillia bacterium]|nr:FIST C-terminal domain-containing protein [Chitinispirillia bacterium]